MSKREEVGVLPRVLFALAIGFPLAAVCSCAKVAAALVSGAQAAIECGTTDHALTKKAREALSHDDAGARLDTMAGASGWEAVQCAVEAIVMSLTSARQDGELGARSSGWKANREDLQPVVDRGRAWLLGRKQK